MKAAKNIKNVRIVNANELNVKNAIKCDNIFITKQALSELELILESRDLELLRNIRLPRPKLPADDLLGIRQGRKPDYFDDAHNELSELPLDLEKDVKIYSKSLHGYLDKAEEYHKKKTEMHDTEDIMFVNKQE